MYIFLSQLFLFFSICFRTNGEEDLLCEVHASTNMGEYCNKIVLFKENYGNNCLKFVWLTIFCLGLVLPGLPMVIVSATM